MKKKYDTFFDESALKFEKIIVSAGKRGLQMEADTQKLIEVTDGKVADLLSETEGIF